MLKILITIILCVANLVHLQQIKVIQSVDERIKLKSRRSLSNSHISNEKIQQMFQTAAEGDQLTNDDTESNTSKVNRLTKIALKVARAIKSEYKDEYIDQYRAPNDFCPYTEVPYCDYKNFYRTEDGSCNNLQYTWWGMSNTPYKRLLEPAYNDGIDEPRTRSVVKKKNSKKGGYKKLPNSRTIAMKLDYPKEKMDNYYTNMLPHFAQFVDHDITLSSLVTKKDGSSIKCKCDDKNDDCINIKMPKNDLINRDQKCMTTPRSSASFNHFNCDLGAREQLNSRTSWLDLSQIYGTSLEKSLSLRSFKGGKLRSSVYEGKTNLPLAQNCTLKKSPKHCFLAADPRIHQNTMLTAIHITFLREHNRLADILAGINPYWNDERLYQETRRVLIAEYQHIVYSEFLPAVISPAVAKLYELEPLDYDYFYQYNPNKYANVANEFSTAAYRFGHTMVKPFYTIVDKKFKYPKKILLEESVLNTDPLFESSADAYIRGSLLDSPNQFDLNFNKYLEDRLFQAQTTEKSETKRYSLPALNINRGRDHGLQPYNEYRALCGLNYAYDFDDLYNIPAKVRRKLKNVYKDVNDIDLFIGGISENKLEYGAVGATFACIIAKQFQDLKFGDRFFYENGQDDYTRFTPEQLDQIRKSSLSQILCDNINMKKVRDNVFLKSSDWEKCKKMEKLDYIAWKDYKYEE